MLTRACTEGGKKVVKPPHRLQFCSNKAQPVKIG